MRKRLINSAGFTVVELSITLVVMGIIMTVVFGFITGSLQQYARDTNRANLLNSAQAGFEVITNDIRLSASADTVNRWPDNNGPSGNQFGWTSDNDTLVLATATEDSAGNIIFADIANYISEKNNIIYFLSDGKLYRRALAAPEADNSTKTTCPEVSATASCPADKVILSDIVDFSVKYIDEQNVEVAPSDARAIELYAKLEKKSYSQPVTVDYKTRMVFRND